MSGQIFLLLTFAAAFWGILTAPLCRKTSAYIIIPMGAAVIASLCGILSAGILLSGRESLDFTITYLMPFGALKLLPDKLSYFFMLITSLVWFPVSVFSFGYLHKYVDKRDLRVFGALYNLLYIVLVITLLAGDLGCFLIAWEIVAIISYLLVNFEYEKPLVTRAGLIMMVMSELGSMLVTAAFIILYNYTGHFDFAGMRLSVGMLPEGIKNTVFILTLLGFGVKAGLVPLHIWLPLAHPAAPGNISALLSGIILNMGIYGIARVILDLIGIGPSWWGLVVVIGGSVTAILGILYALMEQDLKRMLAYSSVENMGVILLGLGAVLIYRGYGLPTLAALAAITALYHTLNHSVYKALLFLGAGAVDYSVGLRNMEQLGGLIKTMPLTALFFLVGSLSISAMPPLNGFVSEWLTLQMLLLSLHLPVTLPKVVMSGSGVVLALTAALVITCFVKACGITFLGQARSERSRKATEVHFSMKLGMGLLAVGCLALGVLPTLVIPQVDKAAVVLAGRGAANEMIPAVFEQPEKFSDLVLLGGNFLHGVLPARGAVVVPTDPAFSSIAPAYLIIALPLAMLLGLFITRLLGFKARVSRGPVWAGGIEKFAPHNQYTATAYSNPVLVLFSSIYRPEINMVSRYFSLNKFRLATNYERTVLPLIEIFLYRPLIGILFKAGKLLCWIQSGRVNQYLSYILSLLVLALVYILL
ncbi:MAG: hydrogenase 4 subunit B [Firmicutes bacterium]|nr:hydrogenase 4 subunit B [Bacillota bacterium]